MFGPDSGKGSWEGLNFMYDRVRVGTSDERDEWVERFINFFREEGCRMVEMTCEEHDRAAASTQFITHSVGRTLGAMNLTRTDIDTKGYESLLSLVENTTNDSFDLYYGLFLYNPNATEELERLEQAFDQVGLRVDVGVDVVLFRSLARSLTRQSHPLTARRSSESCSSSCTTSCARVSTSKRRRSTRFYPTLLYLFLAIVIYNGQRC